MLTAFKMFDKLDNTCVPVGSANFEWTRKNVGFGQLTFYTDEAGNITCRNEMMSKEFIKKMLCQMVDDCSLEDI